MIFMNVSLSNGKKLNKRNLSFSSEITLTIIGKGDQYILNNGSCLIDDINYYFNEKPEEIFINGVLQSYSGNIVYNLQDEKNAITIKFNTTARTYPYHIRNFFYSFAFTANYNWSFI